MSVVLGRGFDEIVGDTTAFLASVIKKYNLSQKMATRLVHDAWARVERERIFRGDPESYIREHLNCQISAYVQAGFHALAGFTEEEFRAALDPLVNKTTDFFSPPAGHPIMDGEFTCFLVLPPEWGCSLRFLLGKLRSDCYESLRDFHYVLEKTTQKGEVAQGGCIAPKTPYVLVGIKAERGLRELTRVGADKEREKFGFLYFSAHQLALLLLLRPDFLRPGESAIALGEKFPEERYLLLTSKERGFTLYISDMSESFLTGVGKPYYTRMITL